MILNAYLGKMVHPRTWPEMAELITEIVERCGPKEGHELAPPRPGVVVTLGFGERAYPAEEFVFECASFLDVAANPQTGYGALIWRGRNRARWGPLADHAWHSDNPQPPSSDPG